MNLTSPPASATSTHEHYSRRSGTPQHYSSSRQKNHKPKIWNGQARIEKGNLVGFRSVSFLKQDNGTWGLAPVAFLAANSNPGFTCTVQEVGDLVVTLEFHPDREPEIPGVTHLPRRPGSRIPYIEELKFLFYTGDKTVPSTTATLVDSAMRTLWGELKIQHYWLDKFLTRAVSPTASSILPLEIVPPDSYEANKAKAFRINEFVDRFGIQLGFDYFQVPINHLLTKPGPPDFPFFESVQPLRIVDSQGRIVAQEKWYSSPGSGAKQIDISPRIVREVRDSSTPEGFRLETITNGTPGIKIPQGAKTLIRITEGVTRIAPHVYVGGQINTFNLNWKVRTPDTQFKQQLMEPANTLEHEVEPVSDGFVSAEQNDHEQEPTE